MVYYPPKTSRKLTPGTPENHPNMKSGKSSVNHPPPWLGASKKTAAPFSGHWLEGVGPSTRTLNLQFFVIRSWWFRNPAINSPVDVVYPIIYDGFQQHDRRISEPSTVFRQISDTNVTASFTAHGGEVYDLCVKWWTVPEIAAGRNMFYWLRCCKKEMFCSTHWGRCPSNVLFRFYLPISSLLTVSKWRLYVYIGCQLDRHVNSEFHRVAAPYRRIVGNPCLTNHFRYLKWIHISCMSRA